MSACGICSLVLARTEKDKIKCGQCKDMYHAKCVNLTAVELQHIAGKPWSCSKCLKMKRLNRSLTEGDISVSNVDSFDYTDAFVTEPLTLDRVKVLISDCLKEFIVQMDEKISNSLLPISANLASNNELLKELQKTIASQNETIKCLRSENVELKHKVIKLSSEFDDLEQYSRRECIEIHGVPEARNENLQKLFQDVGKAIKFKKGYEAVSCCHRLKKRNNQATPGIIVKFTRREDAEDFIQLKKDKGVLTTRDIGLTGANHIFINASLTAKRRVLFGKARQLVKAAKIKYLWVDRAGRIKARVVDGGPVSVIQSDDDLLPFSRFADTSQ